MSKTFSFSKESLSKLKNIADSIQSLMLTREMFLKDENSSIFVRVTINDIPDDFEMSLMNLNSFLASYDMIDNPIIDYSKLEDKHYVKIKSFDSKNKDSFKYVEQESEIAQANTLDATLEENVISDYDKTNSFMLNSKAIVKIMKSGRTLGAERLFFSVSDECVKLIVNHSTQINTNTYNVEFDDSDIYKESLTFSLSYDTFIKLNKNVDEYEVFFGKNTPMKFESKNGDYSLYASPMIR